MELSWNRCDFAEQLKQLEKIVEEENDIKKRTYLNKVLDATRKLYFETFDSFPRPKVTAKQRLVAILDSTFAYNRYYSLVSTFFKNVCEHIELIDEISDELEELDPDGNFDFLDTGATLSGDKLLRMVDTFYKGFDPELYKYFSEVYCDRNRTFKIDKLKNSDSKTDGSTLFIDGVRKNFIVVYETDNVGTTECTVHEYGHAIANLVNPEVSYSNRDDFFMEVASIFPELVALYENGFGFETIQVLYHLYTNLVTYVNSAEYLVLHNPILNAWTDNKYVMSDKFFKEIEKYYDIDEECFEEALSTTIEDQGVYVLSYAVALELLHIYKQDRKKALNLFKQFIQFPANEDVMSFIAENISINSHAGEEAKIILDSFQKELKKRRC